eukprot:TRINITY_DN1513_c0_g1_i1.p1 TRINITY_DN1513_c0_g1~~TRINITY_DN1513_c0_g1_i1.p1  ORF type:complete len:270 (-),score=73.89 TRINITY_DN1513_c0_g1_i1:215-1024(-)
MQAAAAAAKQRVDAATVNIETLAAQATRKFVTDAALTAEQAPGKAKKAEIDRAVKVAEQAGRVKGHAEATVKLKKAADDAAFEAQALKPKVWLNHNIFAADGSAPTEQEKLVHEFSRGPVQPINHALEQERHDSFSDALDREVSTLAVRSQHKKGNNASPRLITDAYKLGFKQKQFAKKTSFEHAFDSSMKSKLYAPDNLAAQAQTAAQQNSLPKLKTPKQVAQEAHVEKKRVAAEKKDFQEKIKAGKQASETSQQYASAALAVSTNPS